MRARPHPHHRASGGPTCAVCAPQVPGSKGDLGAGAGAGARPPAGPAGAQVASWAPGPPSPDPPSPDPRGNKAAPTWAHGCFCSREGMVPAEGQPVSARRRLTPSLCHQRDTSVGPTVGVWGEDDPAPWLILGPLGPARGQESSALGVVKLPLAQGEVLGPWPLAAGPTSLAVGASLPLRALCTRGGRCLQSNPFAVLQKVSWIQVPRRRNEPEGKLRPR